MDSVIGWIKTQDRDDRFYETIHECIEQYITSISPNAAINFTEGDCCFTQMRLKPGMRVIFMEPLSQYQKEFEVLISPGNRFRMIKNKIKKLTRVEDPNVDTDMNYKHFACSEGKRDVRFTLMDSI